MESRRDKVKLLQRAIKQLIEEEEEDKVRNTSDNSLIPVSAAADEDDSPEDGHRQLLLSKLLSQLDALKEDGMLLLEEHRALGDNSSKVDRNPEAGEKSETEKQEIIKELKEVKRQNFITHCLLSALIVLTITWQLSEVSLILKVKEGLSNPLKSLWGMFGGMLKSNRITGQEVDKLASSATPKPILAASSLPGLKIPELPHDELPVFDVEDEE